ncbi:MAG: hypothetical protein J3K34DRAFT_40078 [Monoraphidium minutum]|nr:MAG: hypothetical protein J3K34DRAFT_40078 [Monoraphidium minutum]
MHETPHAPESCIHTRHCPRRNPGRRGAAQGPPRPPRASGRRLHYHRFLRTIVFSRVSTAPHNQMCARRRVKKTSSDRGRTGGRKQIELDPQARRGVGGGLMAFTPAARVQANHAGGAYLAFAPAARLQAWLGATALPKRARTRQTCAGPGLVCGNGGQGVGGGTPHRPPWAESATTKAHLKAQIDLGHTPMHTLQGLGKKN